MHHKRELRKFCQRTQVFIRLGHRSLLRSTSHVAKEMWKSVVCGQQLRSKLKGPMTVFVSTNFHSMGCFWVVYDISKVV